VTVPDGLPAGVEWVRTTPEFTVATVPAGLLREHQVAAGVWGVLRVVAGSVRFVWEGTGAERSVSAGQALVIAPETPHHVEPEPDARFVVEFYR
jgi:tellurite resistance-related uncharacterized protein